MSDINKLLRRIHEERGTFSKSNYRKETDLINEIDNIDYNNLDKTEVKILKAKMNYALTRINIQEEVLNLKGREER